MMNPPPGATHICDTIVLDRAGSVEGASQIIEGTEDSGWCGEGADLKLIFALIEN